MIEIAIPAIKALIEEAIESITRILTLLTLNKAGSVFVSKAINIILIPSAIINNIDTGIPKLPSKLEMPNPISQPDVKNTIWNKHRKKAVLIHSLNTWQRNIPLFKPIEKLCNEMANEITINPYKSKISSFI